MTIEELSINVEKMVASTFVSTKKYNPSFSMNKSEKVGENSDAIRELTPRNFEEEQNGSGKRKLRTENSSQRGTRIASTRLKKERDPCEAIKTSMQQKRKE